MRRATGQETRNGERTAFDSCKKRADSAPGGRPRSTGTVRRLPHTQRQPHPSLFTTVSSARSYTRRCGTESCPSSTAWMESVHICAIRMRARVVALPR